MATTQHFRTAACQNDGQPVCKLQLQCTVRHHTTKQDGKCCQHVQVMCMQACIEVHAALRRVKYFCLDHA